MLSSSDDDSEEASLGASSFIGGGAEAAVGAGVGGGVGAGVSGCLVIVIVSAISLFWPLWLYHQLSL